MKTELHPCFILHTRPYRETSLMLDIFSSLYGRISLVAKGVKGYKHSQSSLLQPGRKLNISWVMKKELGTMVGLEANGPVYKLTGTQLISCFYMNELLVRMLHTNENQQELFDAYDKSIVLLHGGELEERVLRIFEKNLLQALGYGLNLVHESDTGVKISEDIKYFYQADFGPIVKIPKNAKYIDVSGKTLRALHYEDYWDDDISKEAKALLKMILDIYIGDRPIASRALYKAYLKNITPT